MHKKSTIIRFLITYLCVMIPILLVSVYISGQTIVRLTEEKKQSVENRLTSVAEKLNQSFQGYSDNAIRMSAMTDLLPYFMLSDEANTVLGLNTLAKFNSYDRQVYDIFTYYGTGRIYSAFKGTSSLVYFRTSLGINSEDCDKAVALLDQTEPGYCLLWKSDRDGYLLLHFPQNLTSLSQRFSVNDVVPFSSVMASLDSLLGEEPIFVDITLRNGDQLLLYGDASMPLTVQSPNRTHPQLEDQAEYTSVSRSLTRVGATLTIRYRPDLLLADVRYSQTISNFIIICGIFVSMLVAYLFSKLRQEKLRRLEQAIEYHTVDDRNAGLGEFEYIHQLIVRSARSNTAELKKYNELLKEQTASMIFNGILHDRSEINDALARCGICLNEEHYFVGAILSDDQPDARARLKEMLSGDLFCETETGSETAIVFLAELPNSDRGRNMRMKLMEKLMQILALNGSENIRICVSQVYRYLPLANLAYMETMSAMESLHAQNRNGIHILFWENMIQDSGAPVQFRQEDLAALSEAVEQRSEKQTDACLHRLCQFIDTNSGIPENKRYLRYCILQSVITAMKATASEEDQTLLTELIRINPSEENTFEKKVHSVLFRFCDGRVPNGDFQRIVAYMNAHFTDHDLSAEQVAQQVGYTKFYLAKLFKARMGCSYIDYLTQLRMNKACALLASTTLSVSEIVTQVGYVDDSSFRRKFKQLYGMNMSEYRAAHTAPGTGAAVKP